MRICLYDLRLHINAVDAQEKQKIMHGAITIKHFAKAIEYLFF